MMRDTVNIENLREQAIILGADFFGVADMPVRKKSRR
jgi:hypothetical protein